MVSVIGFGSTELGMDYGIKAPGDYGKPDKRAVRQMLHWAIDNGINFFDTAPGYGDSEKMLGEVLAAEPCYIATKINLDEKRDFSSIKSSIQASLRKLNRDYLDLLQIHNPLGGMVNRSEMLENLIGMRKDGLFRFLGVSVYEPADALEALKNGSFDSLQVAFNIMDQRILDEVIPYAVGSKTAIISRSAYFRGMLTNKIACLDDNWAIFKEAASRIKSKMRISDWEGLTEMALRFCLSADGISTVLVGMRTMNELTFAVKAQNAGALPQGTFKKLLGLRINDGYWLNPLNWYRKL